MTGENGRRTEACLYLFGMAAQCERDVIAAGPTALDPAGLDWNWLAAYLTGSGLARPLLNVLNNPLLAGTPDTFRSLLAQSGMVDVVRERALREIIGRIDTALNVLGGRGVLLKGTALLMRAPHGTVSRATSDVDILVPADLAPRLRAHLLAHGFNGAPESSNASHHLAPVSRSGIDVEIHTRIMESFWGLPEPAMLEAAEPLPESSGCTMLSTLSAEGIVLHSLFHLSASFYSFGLRTAWDVIAVLRSAPTFNWDQLTHWGTSSALPLAFWAPFTILASEVPLCVPDRVLREAPADQAACRIAQMTRSRIFSATEGLTELDAMSKTAFVMLLHASWPERLRHVRRVVGFRAARPETWGQAAGRATRARMLWQFWRNYRKFRKLARRSSSTSS